MKAVLAATSLAESHPALEWCKEHLHPGDVVTVVYGVSGLGEFALGLPPFDTLGGEAELRAQFRKTYCTPLNRRGSTPSYGSRSSRPAGRWSRWPRMSAPT